MIKRFKNFEVIEEQMKKYEITFTNPNFYTSDNTLTAFVRKLKKYDPNLQYDSTKNGKAKNVRIIYIKSTLTQTDIKKNIDLFTPKYDSLKIQVVTKNN